MFAARPLHAANVNLAWEANTEPDLAGYRVHYGLSSRAYTTELDVGKTTTTTIVNLLGGAPYYFAVTAYDGVGNESDYSSEVLFTPLTETISTPRPPGGPTSLQAGVAYVFTARGALSSNGDAVQYRFSWSDGTDSDWLPVGTIEATKSWAVAAMYTNVRVEARCAAHPSIVSPPSDPLTVTVGTAPAETVSQPRTPAGPDTVTTVGLQEYATGGAVATGGHPIQYRFLWADGTASPWLKAGVQIARKAWGTPGTYAVQSEARCELHPTVHSTPSPALHVQVLSASGEAIAAPGAPEGRGDGLTGVVYDYAAGNAAASSGDPVQYRFQWGDGTVSAWLSPDAAGRADASKSWAAEGVYSVAAEARCALHPSVPAASAAVAMSVLGGSSLLFADSFSDGGPAGDPQWQSLSGRWTVGANKAFASVNLASANHAVVRELPGFAAGRLSTKIKLSPGSPARSVGIVFAQTDRRHYRYVFISESRLTIGQVGDTAGEKAGPKKSVAATFRPGVWHRLRVDVYPNGRTAVFIGNAAKPALGYTFGDSVAGQFGCSALRTAASFDDFRAWDERALR